jgi:hypothetical protein
MPLMVTMRAINDSSSINNASAREGISPEREPSAIALMVAILVAEKPHPRSASTFASIRLAGVGNGASLNSALSRPIMASPAFAVSCW